MATIAELAQRDARRRRVLEWFVKRGYVGDTRTQLMYAANTIGDCNAADFQDMQELGLLSKDAFNLSGNPFNGYTPVTDAGLEVLGIDAEAFHLNVWQQAEDSIALELQALEDEIGELDRKS